MLAEERMAIILEIINEQKAVKLSQLCEMLDASISTVRRDINSLADMGKIVKVHGGAMALDDNFSFIEHNVEEKLALFTEEKIAIAKYAASLIEYGDFVYIDAGTTTEKMIDFIPQKDVSFVTNGFTHAKNLHKEALKFIFLAERLNL